MRRGVDPARQAGCHDKTRGAQGPGEFAGKLAAGQRGVAGPHDRQGRSRKQAEVADRRQYRRRIGQGGQRASSRSCSRSAWAAEIAETSAQAARAEPKCARAS